MATAASIPQMHWENTDLCEAIALFKQKMTLYIEDEEITEEAKQARKICRGVGDEGLRRLNASALSDADKKKPAKLWEFFEGQLKLNVNFRIHRLQLMQFRQRSGESLDDFVTRARTLALKCEFGDDELQERVIELIIASTPYEGFRNLLYSKAKGTKLADVLSEGRKYEAIYAGNHRLTQLGLSTEAIQTVTRSRRACPNCDTQHKPRECPAYYDDCSACGIKGHWAKCCRKTKHKSERHRPERRSHSRNNQHRRRSKDHPHSKRPNSKSRHRKDNRVHEINTNESSDYYRNAESEYDSTYTKEFDAITLSDKCMDSMEIHHIRQEAFISLRVKPPDIPGQNHTLKLKIDTGASGNTLPLRTLKQMYGTSQTALKRLKPIGNVRLTSYSGDNIPCLGTICIPCKHKSAEWLDTKFYVVDVPGPAILGLPTSEQLKIVTIHIDGISQPIVKPAITDIESLKHAYPNQFDTIGNFPGTAKLHLKDDAEPFIDPPRKCSIHLKDKLKGELDKLIEDGVLRRVTEHTDWCSSLAFSTKKDSTLRICLDPQKLNDNLRRCPHKIPTVEELNPQFAGATVFSKLDAKAGYWSIHLDEDSQLLTTFRTPFGRYCWRRLPFGLRVSQDIFQARMDNILEDLNGVISIADDVAVVGRTEAEHDANLHNLMTRAAEKGLVFNSKKCNIKTDRISFFGNLYTPNGVQPDPAKIHDIQNMSTPTSKDEVQRFLGMLNYLAPYIPKLAESAYVLRDLIKKDTPWTWDETHEHCFKKLKSMITPDACLAYYDPTSILYLEVDASQKGLGVALTQDGKPVAFASKTLNECQSRYSNIEREMLAIVHGIQRYHTYLYGKPFVVVTDHKPLVTICHKPLHAAPPRLQRMLMKIQGYNFTIMYRPGQQMIMADVLSRLPNPANDDQIELDDRVDGISIDMCDYTSIAMINFSSQKQALLRDETAKDTQLCLLKEVILHGWPEKIQNLPDNVKSFWSFRDELSVEAGVVVKGNQILIPETMREDILEQLHNGHQGIEKTQRLARESVYWVNINKDIEKLCKSCDSCSKYQAANVKQPLTPHKVPSRPWQYISSDIFEANGKQYLLTVDRYSKFPILEELPVPASSRAVTERLKFYVSLFGRPDEIMTDNGPQYAGQAFQKFVHDWSIEHVTSAPRYAQSNGFIERHVRTVKAVVKKCLDEGEDVHKALLHIRATPVDSVLPSPAEMTFGRKIPTFLPSRVECGKQEHRQRLEERNTKMKENHDRTAGNPLPDLYPGQQVHIRNTDSKLWQPGIVLQHCEDDNSYMVETWNGAIVRRTRSHLKDRTTTDHQKHVRFINYSEPRHEPENPGNVCANTNSTPRPHTSSEVNTPVTHSPHANSPKRTRSGRVSKKPRRYEDM